MTVATILAAKGRDLVTIAICLWSIKVSPSE
jgi:hypothetical protein